MVSCSVGSLFGERHIDGYIARKLNQVSDFGAKLDSWGDALTYASMIFGLYQIWPAIFTEQKAYLLSATLSFIIPLMIALMKFGEYPSYHTWGAKVAAVLIAPAYYMLILIDADTWFRLVILFYLLVAAEEILITLVLKSRPLMWVQHGVLFGVETLELKGAKIYCSKFTK